MAPALQKPQPGLLRIPTVPNFPLSSPITEEVDSPTSSPEDREMARERPYEYLAAKSSSQNPFIHEADYNTNRSQHGSWIDIDSSHTAHQAEFIGDGSSFNNNGIMKQNPDKPVGLNLVTDFTLASPPKRNDTPAGPFVDLDDLKQLSRAREQERSAQKLKGILKKGTAQGFHRLPEEAAEQEKGGSSYLDLGKKGSSSKKGKDELSPSDRPIMIGYSGPFDETDPRKDKPRELDSACSQLTPLTPSIVVTPAKGDSFWGGRLSPEQHRPRVASSVYSQPTPCLMNGEVPPVPAIPAFHSTVKNGEGDLDLLQRQSVVSRKQRPFSTGTLFEDDSPPGAPGSRFRSYSNENLKRSLDRLSINTDTNRHQSQGWWNYLLTPMMNRSSTWSRKTTPTSPEIPPLPTLITTSPESSVNWWDTDKEVSCFSPDTPETSVAGRGEVPSWNGAGTNPFAGLKRGNNEEENSTRTGEGQRGMESSLFSSGSPIQGHAAEYYQACAHELFSGTPYFECCNHVCSITPKGQAAAPIPQESAQPTQGDRGLAIFAASPHLEEKPASSPADKGISSPTPTSPNTQSVAIKKAADAIFNAVREMNAPKEKEGSGTLPKGGPPTPIAKDSPKPPQPVPEIYSEKQAPESYNQPVVPSPNPDAQKQPPAPASPGPISPAYQQATERSGPGFIPLAPMPMAPPVPAFVVRDNNHHSMASSRMDLLPMTRVDMSHPVTERDRIESRRRRLEKEDKAFKKSENMWRGRCLFSNKKGCFGKSTREGKEGRTKRRWYCVIATFFLIIIIIAIILAIKLTRNGDDTPGQSRWLNLTGYPPMPTGVATVAGPEAQVQNSGCIKPSTLWSCALPKEDQSANKPYNANNPNFRVNIQFQNGTYDHSTTIASRSNHLLGSRAGGFEPSPSAPSIKDQTFLGNTTDKNSVPFAGEETPFFISMLSTVSSSASRLARRSDDLFPNLRSLIPDPDLASDGTAAAATLYPLLSYQPIRLYNRGKDDEHYGFYTYFDRSIFLETNGPLNGNGTDTFPNDANGGSTKEDAKVRCTWAQTRFLVQIWTRSTKTLLTPSSSPTPTATTIATQATQTSKSTTSSYANDFTRPGSFPYPVTITLDRHGGTARKKMVYCYGMEENQHVNSTAVKLQVEQRGFDGTYIDPAPGIFSGSDSSSSSSNSTDSTSDGIDGGTGGCSCQWTNWISTS
ncbi:hypothetical protein MW887_004253 [Aspergillus wentii]|nr:hypothetical protein MW887_004253 [Aspergillus wentii]